MYEIIYFENLDNILNQKILKKNYDLVFTENETISQTFTVNKTLFDILSIEYMENDEVRHTQFLEDFTPTENGYMKRLGDFFVGVKYDIKDNMTNADHLLYIARKIS